MVLKRDLIVGLDAGTSLIKAVIFDLHGHQLAQASRRNHYVSLPNGGVEQDMNRTWDNTQSVLGELFTGPGSLASRVLALGVTGQGDGTWLIDSTGNPVHDAWLWLDARSHVEAEELAQSENIDTIYNRTATGVNVCQMRTQLLWMKKHAPTLLARADTAFHCKDWLYFRLTGVRATDPTEAVFTFGDFRTRSYSDDVLEALGCADLKRLLPPIVDGSSTVSGLSGEVARQTGLPAGLPVSLGCVDVVCSAIGAGLHDLAVCPGMSVLGSTGMHMVLVPTSESVVLNPDRTGYTMALPGSAYSQMHSNMAATLNIDWLLELALDILASEGIERCREDLLARLGDKVLETKPGAAIYHPYISAAGERGPFINHMARASFTGLDQSTKWIDLIRSVYDSLVLSARDCYSQFGRFPPELRLTGGASGSQALRAMLASALRAPVRTVSRKEAGAAGAAMIAAVGQGVFRDISEATRAWVLPFLGDAQEPDPDMAKQYDELFDAYVKTRQAMVPAWTAQAKMRSELQ